MTRRRQRRTVALIASVIALASSAAAQAPTFPQRYSVPEWVETAMTRAGLDRTLAVEARLNPFILRADFDGDGRADAAVLVADKASGKKGIAIVHRATSRVFVVGAGRANSNGGDDFSWMDTWTVFDKGPVRPGATKESPPALKGDALLVAKSEAADALLWWDGTTYRWYQQGD